MSRDLGKKIKILAIVIGALGCLSSLVMALLNMNQSYINLFAWLFIAIAFLVLIIPVNAIGNIIIDNADQKEKMQKMSDRISSLSIALTKDSPADRFSPSESARLEHTGSRTRVTRMAPAQSPIMTRSSAGAEDFTRSLPSDTLMDTNSVNATQSAKPYDQTSTITLNINQSPTLKNIFGQTGDTQPAPIVLPKRREQPQVITSTNTISMSRPVTSSYTTMAAGGLHSVYITGSGRVLALGHSDYGQCNVDDWRNVSSVSAGNHHTVGLLFNGTCVATGHNSYNQCSVGSWSNVVQLASGFNHTIGLLENGSCVATGDNTYGQCNVMDWFDITYVAAGNNYTVGIKRDGSVVAAGLITDWQWQTSKWNGLTAVAAGGFHAVGLKSDGTCVAVGNNANEQCEVYKWKNVKAIAAGNYHTVALLTDGTCIATGYNGYGQCEVRNWSGVVAIAAGRNHTLGLTSDGLLLAVGDNQHGQCSSLSTHRIKVPKNR